MKHVKNLFRWSLFAVMISGLFVHCDTDALTPTDQQTRVQARGCNEITQTYVNGIKSLAASEFSVAPGLIQVGVAERVSSTEGLWHAPNAVVGLEAGDFEDFLFIAYRSDPLTDPTVMGYWYDETYCTSPKGENILLDDLETIVYQVFGFIVDDDIDGF